MAITVVDLRQLQNKSGSPPYPDTPPNTIYAQDWNAVRGAISKGTAGIYALGVKVGAEGFATIGETPFSLAAGLIVFRNAAADDAQVGYLSNTGELGMVNLRADQKLLLAADAEIRHEGDALRTVPEETPTNWHLLTKRGSGTVEDFDVYHDGSLEVIRKLQGDYAADKIGSGFILRYAGGLSRLRLNSSGQLLIEDVNDYAARPITYTNPRLIMTGSGSFVDDVTADPASPILVTEPSSDPKIKQISIADIGAGFLAIGAGTDDVNVDALMAGGGGIGALAALTTPAEKALISTNAAAIAALQAEMLTVVKSFRTSGGQIITPDSTGRVQVANSSSVLWDKPTTNTIRAVASGGGGGGGGGVSSVTGGNGVANIGSSSDPILVVDLAVGKGLEFSGGELQLAWAGTGGDFGTTTLAARSNHTHAALYSALGHSHAGMALLSDITYETLDGNGDVGTTSGTLAAGNDTRFHTQHTDLGTSQMVFLLRRGFASAPATSDVVGIAVERGTAGADARIYWDELNDVWVAGVVGSELAIVLTTDARLSNARTPTSHDITSSHTGNLPGARVAPGNTPSAYTAASSTLDGHLSGIDSALGSVAGQDEETFVGFTMSFSVNDYLVGQMGTGATVRRDGTLNVARLTADVDLGIGESIDIEISNITNPASSNITLNAGERFTENLLLNIPFSAGDELTARIASVTGVPTINMLQIELVRE